MATTDDGFELAEADLRMRGPGEMWGTRQAGLPDLKLAGLARDESLLLEARDAGRGLVAGGGQLLEPGHPTLRGGPGERVHDAPPPAAGGGTSARRPSAARARG